MSYFRDYMRNILILVLLLAGMWVFMRIFYPDALALVPAIGEVYTLMNLWPIMILALLAFLLPRRRR
jgi:hypothetical protein